jgi:hypothetical protein
MPGKASTRVSPEPPQYLKLRKQALRSRGGNLFKYELVVANNINICIAGIFQGAGL